MKNMHRLLVPVLLFSAILGPVGATNEHVPASGAGGDPQASPPSSVTLTDALLTRQIAPDGPAAAVLVARHGKILYEKAFGLADIPQRLPATVETKFRIGSITKQFTASAILRLQEAGKLQLADTLVKFYPTFPNGGGVTLRHLITHTSGLHSYTEQRGLMDGVVTPTSAEALIASIAKLPADFKPGERWSYCNSGYFLLGDIVAKASGLSYEDYLQRTLFDPVGMSSTGIYHNDRPPVGAALGYAFENNHSSAAADWDMSWAGGAGAIYSTVGDLYRWNEAVFGGKVLNQTQLAAAFTPVVTEENKNDNSENGYGYGWAITRFRGAREIGHGGGLPGFSAYLLRLPDQEFTVVVLENCSPAKPQTDPATLSHKIAEIFLGAELATHEPKAAPREAKPVSSDVLASLVGRYDCRFGYMAITQEGDRLFTQLPGQPRFEVFAESESKYFLKVVDAQLVFSKDSAGMVVSVALHQNGQIAHWPRLPEVAEIKLTDTQMGALLGNYELKPNSTATISRVDDRLFGQLPGQPKFELGATSATELFVRLLDARVTIMTSADGQVQKLILHQGGTDQELTKIK